MTRFITATAIVFAAGLAGVASAQPLGGHFIENWDLDGDGQVTLAEAQERRGDVFYSFDADENGFLDAGEYAVFDQARANDMAGQPAHAKGAMQAAAQGMRLTANDSDGDGRVSRDEFVAGTGRWIEAMDRDGDGVVTGADFGQRGQMPGKGMQQGQMQGQGQGPGAGNCVPGSGQACPRLNN
ncbi:EF-hand domain-containing protein [Salipiger sp. P9]|uniref:EF-hand domain-containing protein n=1 Tax=Salipiger pentaromativorans TaxID=2943193 RepID=UPI002157F1F1|nr:EF-hand domain-containing protein [Salipiger pentaromativorans]MCR8547880.1 EF-hand domain-containing protein [Salipiger pentaromativorans]